jgi:hypothetical protein
MLLYSNNDLNADEIVDLYKRRWNIETSFKDQKSNIKLLDFFSTKLNAIEFFIGITLLSKAILEIYRNTPEGRTHGNKSLINVIEEKNIDSTYPSAKLIIKDQKYKYYTDSEMAKAINKMTSQNAQTYIKKLEEIEKQE